MSCVCKSIVGLKFYTCRDIIVVLEGSSLCLSYRQRAELEDLRRQLEENSSLAGRALRDELDKTREEQERRHQVMSLNCAE